MSPVKISPGQIFTYYTGAPPQQDPILSFSHTFPPQSSPVGSRRPTQLLDTPPEWEILDPQLHGALLMVASASVMETGTPISNFNMYDLFDF